MMASSSSEASFVISVDNNVEISRGDVPDYILDFSKIENLVVYDENGTCVRVGEIYKRQKTILILVRHFLCFVCKEYMDGSALGLALCEPMFVYQSHWGAMMKLPMSMLPQPITFWDLALVPGKYFQEAGVQLVVIGCSQPKFIKPFRLATGYSQKLYVDPERTLYKALGCHEKVQFTKRLTESKHVKSGFISGLFQSMFRGMQYREMQGDFNQQGGAFVLGPGDVFHFAHTDETAYDHRPINDLLAIAGVAQVNFDKDKRVLTI